MAPARGSTTSSADEEEQSFAECTEQGGEDRRPQGGSEAGAARHVPGVTTSPPVTTAYQSRVAEHKPTSRSPGLNVLAQQPFEGGKEMARARGSTTSSADKEEQPSEGCEEKEDLQPKGGSEEEADRRPKGGSEAGAAQHVPGVETCQKEEERQLALKSAVEQAEGEEGGGAGKAAEEKEEELRKRP